MLWKIMQTFFFLRSIDKWYREKKIVWKKILSVAFSPVFPFSPTPHSHRSAAENVIEEWVLKINALNNVFFSRFVSKSSFYHSNMRIMNAEKSTWNKIDWSGKTNVLYELMIIIYSVIINNSMRREKNSLYKRVRE